MHSVTQNVCAYMLLSSSIVTIALLLRRQFLQWKSTALYILSASDVLFSVCVSCILFINYTQNIDNTDYIEKRNFSSTCDVVQIKQINSESEVIILEHIITAKDQKSFKITIEWDMVNDVLKYATLLFLLTNSFVSLMIFCTQCNINLLKLKSKSFQVQEGASNQQININISNIKQHGESILQLTKTKDASILKCNIHKMKGCNIITAILLMSQWLLPSIVAGLLYISNYSEHNILNTESTNFPNESISFVEECRNNIKNVTSTLGMNFELVSNFQHKNYVSTDDSVNIGKSNHTELNGIISKIQKIVEDLMNQTIKVPFSDTSRLSATYMPDTDIRNITKKQTVTNEFNYTGNLPLETYQNIYNLTSDDNYTNGYNLVKLGNLRNKTVQHTILCTINSSLYSILHKHMYNSNKKSDNRYNKEVARNNKITMYNNYTFDKCFVYYNGLKLCSISFVAYFLPILCTSILHKHGKLSCRILLEKLKAHNKVTLNDINNDTTNESTNVYCNLYIDSIKPGTSKQDFPYLHKGVQKSMKPFEPHDLKIEQDYSGSLNELTVNIVNEIENTLKLFDAVKTSLLSCILLWMPLISEFFINAFTLLSIPQWSIDVAYLGAIMFNVLRNVFNLRMVKLQEMKANSAKTSSVTPLK